LVSGYDGDQVILNDRSRTPSNAEGFGKMLLVNSYPVYMIFMLVNFILSIMQTQYREVHRVARDRISRGGRTTSTDIQDAAAWLYRWCGDTCTGARKKQSPSKLHHADIVSLFENQSLSKAELETLEKMKAMKENLAKGIENVLKPAVENAEEREARCRGMKVTLGGVVLSFDDVLTLFEKTQTVAVKLQAKQDEMESCAGDGEKSVASASAVDQRGGKTVKELLGLVAVAEVGHESFVPAHPLDPLQATIHAVNVVGWYPEVGLCTLESS
jgi:hypothetical protein